MRIVGLLALLLAVAPTPVPAQEDPGRPWAERPLVDEEFGVVSHAFGLRRQVEMAQWRRSGGEYLLVWSAQPIDSSRFPRQHRNPGEFRLRSREWTTAATMPDGRPLAEAAVEALGIWRPLAPDPGALPENLAATFQPDGDMLTTADDPSAPRVGDLRIRWFERVLPPLRDRVVLRGGVWIATDAPADTAEVPPPDAEGELRSYTPWLGGLLLLIVAVVVAVRHRRRRRRSAPP